MDTIRVYFSMALASMRSQMQHLASFWMGTIGNFCATVIDFIGIFVLFSSFGTLGEWTLAQVAVFYGMVNTSFALAEAIGRGFATFQRMIKQGDFDRLLLRPRGTVMQVLASDFELTRLGRIVQGVGVLTIGILVQPEPMSAGAIALIVFSVAGGVLLFLGLLMMQGAACFWTVESLEVFNVFTFGGIAMASYPLDIYKKWFRSFFLFVLPIGFINYLPGAVLFSKTLPYPVWTAYLAPAAGLVFLMLGVLLWKLGVRHYRSAGA